jgi:hypothetical protein
MKNLLITFVLLIGIVTGVLHNYYSQHEIIRNIMVEQTYTNPIPDVIIDPMIDLSPY